MTMSIIDNLDFADVRDFDVGCGLAFVFLSCVAIYKFVSASKSKQRHALMSATKTSLIRDLKSGPAEVAGRAKLKTGGLKSPWSNRECVYYRFHVEEYRSTKDSSGWYTCIDDSASSKFLVADETGEIEILVSEGEMDLFVDWRSRSSFDNDAPDQLRNLLIRKYGMNTQGLFVNKKLRYAETYLEAGDQVYVFGQASQADDGRWVMRHGEMPLIVSDGREHYVETRTRKSSQSDMTIGIGAAFLAVFTLTIWGLGHIH